MKARTLRAVLAVALLLVGATVSVLVVPPQPATAATQLVSDLGHTAQTIIHYIGRIVEIAQKAQQIINQYQQIVNEARMIANQVQALRKLDLHSFRDIEATLRQIEAVMNGHLIPSHLSPGVRGIHTEAYRGWNLPFDTWTEEKVSVTSSLDTMRESLWAKHLQHRTTLEHLEELEEMKSQIEAAEGHEEILEVIGTLAAFSTEADLLAQISAQTSADAATAYYSYQVNRLARQGRSLEEGLKTSIMQPPDLTATPGWGALPGWWNP